MRRLSLLLWIAGCGNEESPGPIGDLGQPTQALIAGWTPHVEVVIDDYEPQWLLVDTGAPGTYVDPEVYSLDADVDVLRGTSVGAFGLTFEDRDVRVLDLGGALAGLLGADVLSDYQFLLDYQNGDARLLDTDLPADVGADTMPAEVVDAPIIGGGRRVVVDAEIEGVAARVMIDTGATYVTIDPAFLEELDGADRPELCCQTVTTKNGPFDVPITRLKSLRLGGVGEVASVVASPEYQDSTLLARLSAEVGGEPLAALIGGTYLRQFLVTVDYLDERLWLERYRTDSHIPAGEYVGPGFELGADRKDRLIVTHVYEGTSAELAGITANEFELLEIDGEPVAGMPLAAVRSQIRALPTDSVRSFGFYLAATDRDVTFDLLVQNLLPDYR